MRIRNMSLASMLALVTLAPAIARGGGQPEPNPPPVPPARFESVTALLDHLEQADEDIRSLSAKVQYLRNLGEIEGNASQIRRGEMHYVAEPTGQRETPIRRKFAVVFDSLIIDGAMHDDEQIFVFDGEWFIEKLPEEKQMTRRRVVRPGETADPFRIGEGPFAVPIGQRRRDVLERFEAKLVGGLESLPVDAMSASQRERFDNMYQVVLRPRANTALAEEIELVRVWYDPDSLVKTTNHRGEEETTTRLLPRKWSWSAHDGSTTDVTIADYTLNRGVPSDLFDVDAPDGWDVYVEEFRQAAAP